MKVKVTFGQDLSAYAEVDVKLKDGLTNQEVINEIKEYASSSDFDDIVFTEEWSTQCALRIVSVTIDDGETIITDQPIEPSCYETGAAFSSWLKGRTTLDAAIESAKYAKVIPDDFSKESLQGLPTAPSDQKTDEFIKSLAALSIWEWDKDDGSPYDECDEPNDGFKDSHNCLMHLIEQARAILAEKNKS